MDRKKFLKAGLLGTGILAAKASMANLIDNDIDELHPLNIIGFNHIPNDMSASTTTAANSVLHRADTRGLADHGWLKSRHTFSFANYYNPERMHFGVLRVLNDDIVSGGKGFGTHPHDNMEIISIPLAGDLEHRDSMQNVAVIRQGDIQVMSAGTGITHSEYNKNVDQEVRFLQIWMFPNQKGVKPRYDQIKLEESAMHNQFAQILSPSVDDAGVWVHQNAWFNLGQFDAGQQTTYTIHQPTTNGVYAFVIEGAATINGQSLQRRDGFGVWDISTLDIRADTDARILLMEVPMQL
jgi:quercetin 2,3-dioxygenase